MPLHSSIVESLPVNAYNYDVNIRFGTLWAGARVRLKSYFITVGSGYVHGCDDSRITDFSARYINQPEKGPNFHTDEFMRGYDAGYNACFE